MKRRIGNRKKKIVDLFGLNEVPFRTESIPLFPGNKKEMGRRWYDCPLQKYETNLMVDREENSGLVAGRNLYKQNIYLLGFLYFKKNVFRGKIFKFLSIFKGSGGDHYHLIPWFMHISCFAILFIYTPSASWLCTE